jgi:hypothetical protein
MLQLLVYRATKPFENGRKTVWVGEEEEFKNACVYDKCSYILGNLFMTTYYEMLRLNSESTKGRGHHLDVMSTCTALCLLRSVVVSLKVIMTLYLLFSPKKPTWRSAKLCGRNYTALSSAGSWNFYDSLSKTRNFEAICDEQYGVNEPVRVPVNINAIKNSSYNETSIPLNFHRNRHCDNHIK